MFPSEHTHMGASCNTFRCTRERDFHSIAIFRQAKGGACLGILGSGPRAPAALGRVLAVLSISRPAFLPYGSSRSVVPTHAPDNAAVTILYKGIPLTVSCAISIVNADGNVATTEVKVA